jgi:hypothetical protein
VFVPPIMACADSRDEQPTTCRSTLRHPRRTTTFEAGTTCFESASRQISTTPPR